MLLQIALAGHDTFIVRTPENNGAKGILAAIKVSVPAASSSIGIHFNGRTYDSIAAQRFDAPSKHLGSGIWQTIEDGLSSAAGAAGVSLANNSR